MHFDAPFKIGPFIVDHEGRLTPNDPQASLAFLLRWRARVVRAHLAGGRRERPPRPADHARAHASHRQHRR